MKRPFLLLLLNLVFLPSLVSGATYTCGTDGVDDSCTPAGLQALVDNANDGDTINIASGTHSWGSSVMIEKAVTISGGGVCNDCGTVKDASGTWDVIISRDGQIFNINDPTDAGYTGRITGIHFQGDTCWEYSGGCGTTSFTCTQGEGFVSHNANNVVQFRIDNNRFEITNGGMAFDICADNAYPLIDNNYVTQATLWDNSRIMKVQRRGSQTAGEESYMDELTWGDGNFVFVEDNTFIGKGRTTGSIGQSVVDCRQSGRIVFRHNIVTDAWFSIHGPRRLGWFGCQGAEIYGNKWYWDDSDTPCHNAVSVRGGGILAYNNIFNTGSHGYNRLFNVYNSDSFLGEGGAYAPDCDENNQLDGNWAAKSNADCTGEYEPYGCCTGLDTGICGSGYGYPSGYPCFGDPGWGSPISGTYPDFQPQAPTRRIHIWNNTGSGTEGCNQYNQVCIGNSDYIQEGREWFHSGIGDDVAKPAGYVAYTYPHPLRASAATYICGTDGVDNSCTSSDFQAIINNAIDGDTINIATGIHSWTSSVTINKALRISGGGTCNDCGTTKSASGTWNTVINRDGRVFYINDISDAGYTGRITGIKFIGSPFAQYAYSYECGPGDSDPHGWIAHMKTNAVQFRIDNNHFYPTNGGAALCISADGAYPVIDNNFFQPQSSGDSIPRIAIMRQGDWTFGGACNPPQPGSECWDAEAAWQDPFTYGDKNFVFVEDNTFFGQPSTGNGMLAADCRRGGRVVFRYNFVTDNWLSLHGNDKSWLGCQGAEVYNNVFNYDSSQTRFNAASWRSGGLLFYENTLGGTTRWGNGITAWERRIGGEPGDYGPCDGNFAGDGNWNAKSNVDCVGLYNPYGCCTGAGTGTCGDADYPDGYPCVGQCGFGSPIQGYHPDFQPQMPRTPGRIWNNIVSVTGTFLNFRNPTYIKENREYFYCNEESGETDGCNEIESFRGTYTAYPYPHPLRFDSWPPATCNDANCDNGECHSCPQDCTLVDCKNNGYCDTGLQDGSENCQTDPTDCTCLGNEQCCSGICQVPLCSQNQDCGSDPCMTYTCNNPGTCSALCSSQVITSCINNDNCCPSGCDSSSDSDCQPLRPGNCQGLVLLHHFDNDPAHGETPTLVHDFSGNGRDGTVNEATPTPSGRFSGAFYYDGDDDYITIGTGSDFSDLCINGCTFSAWVNGSDVLSSNRGTIVGRYQWNDLFFWLYYDIWYRAGFLIDNDGINSGDMCTAQGTGFSYNTWHHIVGVYNGTYSKIYLDGTERANTACAFDAIDETAWQDPETTFIGLVGETSYSNEVNGVIDELAIWNRSLSDEEIQGLYDSGSPITCGIFHRADNNPQNGCITMQELVAFITLWYQGNASMLELIEAISLWKSGEGCQ